MYGVVGQPSFKKSSKKNKSDPPGNAPGPVTATGIHSPTSMGSVECLDHTPAPSEVSTGSVTNETKEVPSNNHQSSKRRKKHSYKERSILQRIFCLLRRLYGSATEGKNTYAKRVRPRNSEDERFCCFENLNLFC